MEMGKLCLNTKRGEIVTTDTAVHNAIFDNKIMIKRDILFDNEYKFNGVARPLSSFVSHIQHFYYQAVPNFLYDSIFYDDRIEAPLRELCGIVLRRLINDGYINNMCGVLFTYGSNAVLYITNADYIHGCHSIWIRLEKIERDLVKGNRRGQCFIC